MMTTIRRGATVVAGSLAVLLTGSAAMAHECYNASRQGTQGDIAAGTHSQAWFYVTIEDIVGFDIADGLYTEEDAPCVLAGWRARGGAESFTIHVKGANGQDGVVARNAPSERTSDGRGIDHLSHAGDFDLYAAVLAECGLEVPDLG